MADRHRSGRDPPDDAPSVLSPEIVIPSAPHPGSLQSSPNQRSGGLRVYRGGCSFGIGFPILPLTWTIPIGQAAHPIKPLRFAARWATRDRMWTDYVFGYGSLVNRATHEYPDVQPATLHGWRRVWRHTPLRRVAYLTVEPDDSTDIEGVTFGVRDTDWPDLTEREAAYVTTTPDHVSPRPDARLHLYHIPDGHHGPPTGQGPVVLSYLDTVVKGFLDLYGEEGVARFFMTTTGWEGGILDDRTAPRYSRHTELTADETRLVDHHLARLSAVMHQLD